MLRNASGARMQEINRSWGGVAVAACVTQSRQGITSPRDALVLNVRLVFPNTHQERNLKVRGSGALECTIRIKRIMAHYPI